MIARQGALFGRIGRKLMQRHAEQRGVTRAKPEAVGPSIAIEMDILVKAGPNSRRSLGPILE